MNQSHNPDEAKKLQTEPYKGVRDFYPDELQARNYIFSVWRKTLQSFGYSEYDASILEPTELYKQKSGEEIINEQTYSFIDRGERDVTLRPEMTPTVARMVAAKRRELNFPLRWFSIPNLFRYERPQRGRLREHWQLNADIFGVDSVMAEVELIEIAGAVMKNFGLNESQFEIRVSSRRFLDAYFSDFYELDEERAKKLQKLVDRKAKLDPEKFQAEAEEIVGGAFTFVSFGTDSELRDEALALTSVREAKEEIDTVLSTLKNLGINNARFDAELVRGFDYYTGIVFEIFDTNPENRRSLFGGGRYDELLELFGNDSVPAAGFGMGDVTIHDTLETYGLLPQTTSSTKLYICTLSKEYTEHALALAQSLREKSITVAVNLTEKKVGDQLKYASKEKIPFVIVVGEDETTSKTYTLKNLESGQETKGSLDVIISHLQSI